MVQLDYSTQQQLSGQRVDHVRPGYSRHQKARETDLGADFVGDWVGLSLWDCNTHPFIRKLGVVMDQDRLDHGTNHDLQSLGLG